MSYLALLPVRILLVYTPCPPFLSALLSHISVSACVFTFTLCHSATFVHVLACTPSHFCLCPDCTFICASSAVLVFAFACIPTVPHLSSDLSPSSPCFYPTLSRLGVPTAPSPFFAVPLPPSWLPHCSWPLILQHPHAITITSHSSSTSTFIAALPLRPP